MKQKFINLTPHSIGIACGPNVSREINPSGVVARVSVKYAKADTVEGVDIFTPIFGKCEDLPDPDPEGYTLFIVSAMVRTHPDNAHRGDLLSPGALLRDTKGVIVGCEGLTASFWKN